MSLPRFSVRHRDTTRHSSENYEYDILDGQQVVATYWHDFRGDEHGTEFSDGSTEVGPAGRVGDFISDGGPNPLALSDAALEYLSAKLGL
jgi:hypothetical protein